MVGQSDGFWAPVSHLVADVCIRLDSIQLYTILNSIESSCDDLKSSGNQNNTFASTWEMFLVDTSNDM